MTRIFTDGAEMQDALFWSVSVPGVLTVASATPAISPYYYNLNSDIMWINFTALSECYIRYRFRLTGSSWTSTASRFSQYRLGSTAVAWLALDGAGQLIAQAATIGVLETSLFVPAKDTWYLFEVRFKEANAPDGRFTVYVDGNKVIDYSGDTQPAAATTFDNIYFSLPSNVALLTDDIAINNTAGGVDDSYCGDGIVSKITPDDNGTHNNWHGSDGDDVNNYLLCQEYPKDNDVTYNYHEGAAAGTQQQFGLSDWSGAGKSILRIYAEARVRKTASVAHTIKLGQLAAGGADVVSAGRVLYIDTYNRVVGDDSLLNPVTGVAWVEADLDALEFVAEVG